MRSSFNEASMPLETSMEELGIMASAAVSGPISGLRDAVDNRFTVVSVMSYCYNLF